jgi:hypothetical protein
MVMVASIYLSFYIEVGVGSFLLTPIPPRIPSDSTALLSVSWFGGDNKPLEFDT